MRGVFFFYRDFNLYNSLGGGDSLVSAAEVMSVTITPEVGRRGLPPIRELGGSSENLLFGVDPATFQAAVQQAVRHYSLNTGVYIIIK